MDLSLRRSRVLFGMIEEKPVNMAEVFDVAKEFFGVNKNYNLPNVTVGKYINGLDKVALYAKCGDKVIDVPVDDVNAVYCN